MIQPESSKPKTGGKRSPRVSRKPRLSEPAPEPLVSEPLVSEPLVSEPVRELSETPLDLPVEETKGDEILVEKTLCPCGSVIATKSLAKHEKTKKHLAWLSAQEVTVII